MNAGRHCSFDKPIALDKAMEVFWTNGFQGSSLSDLTQAMGINKSSLYSTFGNKEALFNRVLERYVQKHGMVHAEQLVHPTKALRERIQNYLFSISKMTTNPELPGGCLICNSTSEAGGTCLPNETHQVVTKINQVTKTSLVDFFETEKAAGNIDGKTSPDILASYLMTLQYGLAVMARNGVALKELKNVVKHSIDLF